MHATASDLARFISRVGEETLVGTGPGFVISQQQVDLSSGVSWGLGIGRSETSAGLSLWHWGSNPGSQSLMVVMPAEGAGVVILTNSAAGSDIMYDIAGQVLGVEPTWRIPDAT